MGPRPPRRPLRRRPPVARLARARPAAPSPALLAAGLALACLALAACSSASRPGGDAAQAAAIPEVAPRADDGPAAAPAHPAVLPAPAPATVVTRFVAGEQAQGAALPDDIARGLSTDDRVLDCEQGLVDGRSAFAPGWVFAHRVDLDGDGYEDWLVEGRHACVADEGGADWWLYAEDPDGRRLLLAAGRAEAVEVLPARSDGFAGLRLLREGGGVDEARYDGSAYVLSSAPGG